MSVATNELALGCGTVELALGRYILLCRPTPLSVLQSVDGMIWDAAMLAENAVGSVSR